jgi:hypothetical protein
MKKIAVFSLLIFSILQSFACDYDERSFLWWYFKSDLIFTGKILKVFDSDSASYDVLIVVNKFYKGKSKDTLRLTIQSFHENGKELSDCDVYLKENENWLIYSSKINGKYYSGGQASRSNKLVVIEQFHPQDIKWLESIDPKLEDYYWNWEEWDVAPKFDNINSFIYQNFNTKTVDTCSVHGSYEFILCNIDKNGKLTRANLFFYPKGFKYEPTRTLYEKCEYLNPEVECTTNFQKEAIRVTKMLTNWIPAKFCDQQVKCQVLLQYSFENGKMKIEIK